LQPTLHEVKDNEAKTAKELSRKSKRQKPSPKGIVISKATSNAHKRLRAMFEANNVKEYKTQMPQKSVDETQQFSNAYQPALDSTVKSIGPVSSHGTLDELVPVVRFRERHEEITAKGPVDRKNREYGTLKNIELDNSHPPLDVCVREVSCYLV
uniref:TPX2_importin domain-containing protein n=1 Tax=Toxocara canis TaxID=6265 RepID=A0A183U5T0_TOXCA